MSKLVSGENANQRTNLTNCVQQQISLRPSVCVCPGKKNTPVCACVCVCLFVQNLLDATHYPRSIRRAHTQLNAVQVVDRTPTVRLRDKVDGAQNDVTVATAHGTESTTKSPQLDCVAKSKDEELTCSNGVTKSTEPRWQCDKVDGAQTRNSSCHNQKRHASEHNGGGTKSMEHKM